MFGTNTSNWIQFLIFLQNYSHSKCHVIEIHFDHKCISMRITQKDEDQLFQLNVEEVFSFINDSDNFFLQNQAYHYISLT